MNPRIDDLIVLAALGELTAEQAAELDRHAATDPQVASELDRALATAAMLQSPSAEAPSAALKHSVMDAITGLAQDPAARPSPAAKAILGPSTPADADVLPIGSAHSRRRFPPWVAAAAAVLVIALGAAVVISRDSDSGGLDAEIAAVIEADDAQPHSVAGEIG